MNRINDDRVYAEPPIVHDWLPPPCTDETSSLAIDRRRRAFAAVVGLSVAVLVLAMLLLLARGGFGVLDAVLVVLFACTLPWTAIGFWNAVIGLALLCRKDGLRRTVPLRGVGEAPRVPVSSTAIVVPIRDEEPAAVFRALRASIDSLDATGCGDAFDIFVLSDTRDDAIAAAEVVHFRRWRVEDPAPWRLYYRRRSSNTGFKAGNIESFCRRWGRDYDHMLVLDADSVMSGEAMLRLVSLMEGNPRLGILQSLAVGLPAKSPFARLFQFGMRHGMRTYAMGAAWWQGDSGPYWGHNAIIRLAPFITHCRLQQVAGGPPLGGAILSHDQIEAVLMRRAGFEVRVLPVEDGSFETNPPNLLEFIRRDLRWCHGNMQYLRLFHLPQRRMGRVQLALAIQMYAAGPGWIAFGLLGLVNAALAYAQVPLPQLFAEPSFLPDAATLGALGWGMLATVMTMFFAPKLAGYLQALLKRSERRRYGGARRMLSGASLELTFSLLLTPVISVAQGVFLGGLAFGRRHGWTAQRRIPQPLAVTDAARRLWPQALFGLVIGFGVLTAVPAALPWAAPFVVALLLAVPFAVTTTSRRMSGWLIRNRLCATPEELAPPPVVRQACPWIDGGRLASLLSGGDRGAVVLALHEHRRSPVEPVD